MNRSSKTLYHPNNLHAYNIFNKTIKLWAYKSKNHNLVSASKNFWAYVVTITMDYSFIVIPINFFHYELFSLSQFSFVVLVSAFLVVALFCFRTVSIRMGLSWMASAAFSILFGNREKVIPCNSCAYLIFKLGKIFCCFCRVKEGPGLKYI